LFLQACFLGGISMFRSLAFVAVFLVFASPGYSQTKEEAESARDSAGDYAGNADDAKTVEGLIRKAADEAFAKILKDYATAKPTMFPEDIAIMDLLVAKISDGFEYANGREGLAKTFTDQGLKRLDDADGHMKAGAWGKAIEAFEDGIGHFKDASFTFGEAIEYMSQSLFQAATLQLKAVQQPEGGG